MSFNSPTSSVKSLIESAGQGIMKITEIKWEKPWKKPIDEHSQIENAKLVLIPNDHGGNKQ